MTGAKFSKTKITTNRQSNTENLLIPTSNSHFRFIINAGNKIVESVLNPRIISYYIFNLNSNNKHSVHSWGSARMWRKYSSFAAWPKP